MLVEDEKKKCNEEPEKDKPILKLNDPVGKRCQRNHDEKRAHVALKQSDGFKLGIMDKSRLRSHGYTTLPDSNTHFDLSKISKQGYGLDGFAQSGVIGQDAIELRIVQ